LAAVQGRLAVRIGDGELTEVFAFLRTVREILGLFRDFIELLRGRGRRQL